jgi:hypothetical protein
MLGGRDVTLEAAIAELYEMEGDEIREAIVWLAEVGFIAPTGERRDGRIVWAAQAIN